MSRILPGSRNKAAFQTQAQKQASTPAAKEPAYSTENNPDILAPRNKVATPGSSQGIAWGGPTPPAAQDGFATVVPDAQPGLPLHPSECIRKAVAEIQRGWMPPLSEAEPCLDRGAPIHVAEGQDTD